MSFVPKTRLLFALRSLVVLCVCMIALPSLVGWTQGIGADTSHPFVAWKAMQFLTAAGLVLLAFALNNSSRIGAKISLACCLAVCLMGLSTLLEYLLGWNLATHHWLKHFSPLLDPRYFGRMSSNTALSLTISGAASLILTLDHRNTPRSFPAILLASFTLALSLVTLLGHLYSLESSLSWGRYSYMSIPTASGFLLISITQLAQALSQLKPGTSAGYSWKGYGITTSLIVLSVFAWKVLLFLEGKQISEVAITKLEAAEAEILEKLEPTVQALKRMALRTEYLGIENKEFLAMDAKSYLNHIKILRRIGFIDPKDVVVWAYPPRIAHQILGFNQSSEPRRKDALDKARQTGKAALSQKIRLKSGQDGFILPIPLNKNGKHQGFLYATVDLERLFNSIAALNGYNVQIYQENELIFQGGEITPNLHGWERSRPIETGLASWNLRIAPTVAMISEHQSIIPLATLLTGLFLALLLGRLYQSLMSSRDKGIKLYHSEKRFRELLNAAKDYAVIVCSETGEVSDWSSGSREVTGYSTDEAIGKNISFLFEDKKESPISANHVIDQSLRLGHFSDQCELKRKNGGSFPAAISVSKATDRSGGVKGLTVVVRDLTEQKRVENERLGALKWKESLLNATQYSIISGDLDGIIQTFNSGASKLLGYAPEELIGKSTPAIIHDEQEVVARAQVLSRELNMKVEPGFESFVAKTRITHQPDENEWTYIRKDGSRLTVTLAVSAMTDLNGNITGYLGIAADITEKKVALEKLRVTSERLSRVIHATKEGIWECSLDSKGYTFLDDQAKSIFGFEEIDSPSLQDIESRLSEKGRRQLQNTIEKYLKNPGEGFDLQLPVNLPRQPDQERWILLKAMIVSGAASTSKKLIGTVGDITHQVKDKHILEKALDEARAATRLKSNFLANMTHEIRTPLNGILGMADLMSTTDLDEEQRNFVSILQQSGVSLLGLVNDVLDFSKIEAGKLVLEKTVFKLADLVESQTEILIANAMSKSLSLVTFVDPALPPTFHGDPARLGQILVNLEGNALKFTEKGGVTVRVLRSNKPLTNNGKLWIRIEVEDTGIGMSDAVIEKLFKPFSQGDESTSRKFGGTGLGLSICRRLVDAMGGEIGVTSAETKGSVFWCEIPLRPAVASIEVSKHSQTLTELQGAKILVMGAGAQLREVLEQYLRSWSMQATFIDKIDEGMLSQRPFDLYIVRENQNAPDLEAITKQIQANTGTEQPKMLTIVPFGVRLDRGIKSIECKTIHEPIRQSSLFDALAASLLGASFDKTSSKQTGPLLAEQTTDRKEYRILVADDVAINQLLTRKLLERIGYSVHTVANGFEVLDALQQASFDLILMDCHMPELNGYEATQKIRAMTNPKIKNIPIIALTANAQTGDDKRCTDAGMDDYLSKPLNSQKLDAKIQIWLERRSMAA